MHKVPIDNNVSKKVELRAFGVSCKRSVYKPGKINVKTRIKRFTDKSRRKFIEFILGVDWERVVRDYRFVYFVTFTFRYHFPNELHSTYQSKVAKVFERMWQKRRKGENFCAVVKREFHKDGYPHYHIVLLSNSEVTINKLVNRLLRLVKHEKAISVVDYTESGNNKLDFLISTLFYMAKKRQTESKLEDVYIGKYWWVVNKRTLNNYKVEKILKVNAGYYAEKYFSYVYRILTKIMRHKGINYNGRSRFVVSSSAKQIFKSITISFFVEEINKVVNEVYDGKIRRGVGIIKIMKITNLLNEICKIFFGDNECVEIKKEICDRIKNFRSWVVNMATKIFNIMFGDDPRPVIGEGVPIIAKLKVKSLFKKLQKLRI
ncbi:MAG: hypothetical protein ABIL76_05215 [candidate division WOR-3 bacterium]|jgi:hypothetical protein